MLFLSLDLLFGGETKVPAGQILLAATIAGVTAYCTIALFLAALSRMGMMPFVVYRLLLGAGLVAIVFLGN
jgi:undecaprenyl-diphosphatase